MMYRSSGVGKEIVRQLVERSAGVKLYLITPSNKCRFYEKSGFKALAPWEVPKCVPQCILKDLLLSGAKQSNVSMCVVLHSAVVNGNGWRFSRLFLRRTCIRNLHHGLIRVSVL